MANTTHRVRHAADTARPYVERALTDEEFRESLRTAFVAAKQIYEELIPPRGVAGIATRVAKDEDVQESVRRAIAELRHAADRLQAESRETHRMRNLTLLTAGVLIGIFFNPFTGSHARRWVKTKVVGDELSYDGRSTAGGVTA